MQIVHIEALLMPNGEYLCNGQSLGFSKDIKVFKRFDALTGKEIVDKEQETIST